MPVVPHVKAAGDKPDHTWHGRVPRSPHLSVCPRPGHTSFPWKLDPLIPVYSTHPRSTAFWAGGWRAKASLCDPGQVTPLPLPQACDLPTIQDQGHTGRFATGDRCDGGGEVCCDSLLRLSHGGSGQWFWEADPGLVARGRTGRSTHPCGMGKASPRRGHGASHPHPQSEK